MYERDILLYGIIIFLWIFFFFATESQINKIVKQWG